MINERNEKAERAHQVEPWYLTWLGVRVGSNRLLVKTAIACSGVDTNVEYISKPHTTS